MSNRLTTHGEPPDQIQVVDETRLPFYAVFDYGCYQAKPQPFPPCCASP
ncbi:MAG: hypothetical protein HZA93_29715 [Verrucomicrobia bacterium]|nr:hypothetical protein [Verrucomicrobiota bacterium]